MIKYIGCTRVLDSSLVKDAENNQIIFQDKNFIEIKLNQNLDIENLNHILEKVPVFTSANGVRAFALLLKQNKIEEYLQGCYCIEGKTSKTALQLGLRIKKTGLTSQQIANEIVAQEEKEVVYFTSNIRRPELEEILNENQVAVQIVEGYNKKITSYKLNNLDGMVFFSPSQIDSFYLKNVFEPTKPAFCIGPTTARHLKAKGHQNIMVSEISSEKNIVKKTVKHFNP